MSCLQFPRNFLRWQAPSCILVYSFKSKVYSGHKVLMEAGDNILLIVGDLQWIFDHLLSIIFILIDYTKLYYYNIKLLIPNQLKL
jgi:hypothetical protein